MKANLLRVIHPPHMEHMLHSAALSECPAKVHGTARTFLCELENGTIVRLPRLLISLTD